MRLLTHNQLVCVRKGCSNHYPLDLQATTVEATHGAEDDDDEEDAPNLDFVLHLLPNLNYPVLLQAATKLGLTGLPETINVHEIKKTEHAALLTRLHEVLLDVSRTRTAGGTKRALANATEAAAAAAAHTHSVLLLLSVPLRRTSRKARWSAASAAATIRSSKGSRTCDSTKTKCKPLRESLIHSVVFPSRYSARTCVLLRPTELIDRASARSSSSN